MPFRSPMMAPKNFDIKPLNNVGINAGKAFYNNQILTPKNQMMGNKRGRMFWYIVYDESISY